MEVEIYLDKQLSDITFEVDALEDWKNIAEQLGLDNQLSLTKGKESPIPYPFMNTSMVNVYSTLCPEKVDYRKYNKTPVPLEVLKQILFSVNENHFTEIQVWYDDKSPDPIIVGLHGYYRARDGDWKYLKDENNKDLKFLLKSDITQREDEFTIADFCEEGKYLVARWGDEKRPFDELKQIATDRYIEINASKLKSNIEELKQKLSSIEDNVKLYMNGEMSAYEISSTRF